MTALEPADPSLLDCPIADGDAARINGLVAAWRAQVAAALDGAEGFLVLADAEHETAWIVEQILDSTARPVRSRDTRRFLALDPFLSVERLLGRAEYVASVHNARRGDVFLAENLHHLPLPYQASVVAALRAACQHLGSILMLTAERGQCALVEGPPCGLAILDPGSLPSTGDLRKSLVTATLDASLNRARMSSETPVHPWGADVRVRLVEALCATPFPRGRGDLEPITDGIADRHTQQALTGPDDVTAALQRVGLERSRSGQRGLLTREVLAQRITTVEQQSSALVDFATALLGERLIDDLRLPRLPSLDDDTPSHWFDALTARWYSFCFDAAGRPLRFLHRFKLDGARLIQTGSSVAKFPILVEALRTWRFHALDPASDRAREQRSIIDTWFRKACGTVSLGPEHWRAATTGLLDEVDAYLAHLRLVLQRLETADAVLVQWREWRKAQTERHVFVDASRRALANVGLPLGWEGFVDRNLDRWRGQLATLDETTDMIPAIDAMVEAQAVQEMLWYCPVTGRDVLAAFPKRTPGPWVGDLLHRARELYRQDRTRAAADILKLLKPRSPLAKLKDLAERATQVFLRR